MKTSAALLVLLLLFASNCRRPSDLVVAELLPVGQPMPQLTAQGWLNGVAPTAESLRGKIVVVHVWAYWCRPCLEHFPDLVRLQSEYADRGVWFVGLTAEGELNLDETRAAVARQQATWPIGWGAGPLLTELGVSQIPTEFLIGRDGKVLWNSQSSESLEAALAAQFVGQ